MNNIINLKAYKVQVKGWEGIDFYTAGENAGKAKSRVAKSLKAADYYNKFTDISVRRIYQYDEVAHLIKPYVICWEDIERLLMEYSYKKKGMPLSYV